MIPAPVLETIKKGTQSRFGLTTAMVEEYDLNPTPGHCLVRVDPPEESSGGVIIPMTAREVSAVHPATVLKVRGREGKPDPEFKAGDRVLVELSLDDSRGREVVIVRNERVAVIL